MTSALTPSRRAVLAGAGVSLFAIRTRPADAAEFTYKFATGQSPTNPINTRMQEALDRIKEATGGRVEMRLFPNNQLGSDTDLITQVRSGGVEFLNIAASVLSTLVPACGLVNVGFAFPDYASVWKSVDGSLGSYIRDQIQKSGLVVPAKFADNGFRQISSGQRVIKSPDDLKGFKIRVPVAPLFTGLFQGLGADPVSINFNEVYSALQTRLVDGQENGLVVIETAKLYEVQKHIAETSHIWDPFCIVANRRAFGALPKDAQEIVSRELDRSVMDERTDIERLSGTLKATLQSKGVEFQAVDKKAFREALGRSTFYKDWRTKFGDAAWDSLQGVVGQLG